MKKRIVAIMQPRSTLHRGTYLEDFPTKRNGAAPGAMFCYVMLGGLDHPLETLNSIYAKACCFDKTYGSLSAYLNE